MRLPQWGENISPAIIERVIKTALKDGTLDSARRAMVFHDIDLLQSRLATLNSTFPSSSLHAVAIKANPLVRLLREVVDSGCGLETASLEEVYIARAAGCPANKIVFDSPVKTEAELAESLHAGYILNVDNFDELARIDALLDKDPLHGPIGLRVNPMVGAGKIAITSVADGASKFGIRIDTERANILSAFEKFSWLSGLHIHIGSQGCDLDMLVRGAVAISDLLGEIKSKCGEQKMNFVDIGGGLPVAYTNTDSPPALDEYVSALREHAPDLFSDSHHLITEFGRAVHAGCGFAVAKVEYVKPYGNHQLAAIHLGADMFMRPVYLPKQWRHQCVVLDPDGNLKNGKAKRYSIGGPLCFAGDLLFRDEEFPTIEPEDYLVIRDTGAYTISMWSRHCNRSIPKVVGYKSTPKISFSTVFAGESPESIAEFWSK